MTPLELYSSLFFSSVVVIEIHRMTKVWGKIKAFLTTVGRERNEFVKYPQPSKSEGK
jgi:hypothetical protein